MPTGPGSYQFRDQHGRVIYVGKAANLRSRVANYFQDTDALHPRTAAMVQAAETVEWIEVRNELEALMLEYALIKEHRPRFNVRLRDDKSYPFLAVTVDEEWPRAVVVRGTKRKGTRYFGPYAHAYAIRETLLCPTALGLPNRRLRFYLVAGRGGLRDWPARAGSGGRTRAPRVRGAPGRDGGAAARHH
mgnify:CR=1 FL=1